MRKLLTMGLVALGCYIFDGQSTKNKSLEECLQRLAGAAGEKVVLTINRGSSDTQPFDVTLTRHSLSRPPTDRGERVQWKGNKIVSRVLPYPDLSSLFIRLPIAHAAATGKGIKVAVLSLAENKRVLSVVQEVAPHAEVAGRVCRSDELSEDQIAQWLRQTGCRVVVVPDAPQWPQPFLLGLAKRLLAEKILAVVPSDLSEAADQIARCRFGLCAERCERRAPAPPGAGARSRGLPG